MGCKQYDDFFSALLCMNVNLQGVSYGASYVSSSYLVNPTVWTTAAGSTLRQLATYNSASTTLMKNVAGSIQALSATDKLNLPFAFLANYGKGLVSVVVHDKVLTDKGLFGQSVVRTKC